MSNLNPKLTAFLCTFILLGAGLNSLYADDCEYTKEVILRLPYEKIVWPDTVSSHYLNEIQILLPGVDSILDNYGNTIIKRLFNPSDSGQVLVTNPAGLVTVKPTMRHQYKICLNSANEASNLVEQLHSHNEHLIAYTSSYYEAQSIQHRYPT